MAVVVIEARNINFILIYRMASKIPQANNKGARTTERAT